MRENKSLLSGEYVGCLKYFNKIGLGPFRISRTRAINSRERVLPNTKINSVCVCARALFWKHRV